MEEKSETRWRVLERQAARLRDSDDLQGAVDYYTRAIEHLTLSDGKLHAHLECLRASCLEEMVVYEEDFSRRQELIDEAISCLSNAISLVPCSLFYHRTRAALCYRTERYNIAAQDFMACRMACSFIPQPALLEDCLKHLSSTYEAQLHERIFGRNPKLSGEHMNLWISLDSVDCILEHLRGVQQSDSYLNKSYYKTALISISLGLFGAASYTLRKAFEEERNDPTTTIEYPEFFLLLARIYIQSLYSALKFLNAFLDWWDRADSRQRLPAKRVAALRTTFLILLEAVSLNKYSEKGGLVALTMERAACVGRFDEVDNTGDALVQVALLLIGQAGENASDGDSFSSSDLWLLRTANSLCVRALNINKGLHSAKFLLRAAELQMQLMKGKVLKVEDLRDFEASVRAASVPSAQQRPHFVLGMRLLLSIYHACGFEEKLFRCAEELSPLLPFPEFCHFCVAMKSESRMEQLASLARRNPESSLVRLFLHAEYMKRDRLEPCVKELQMAIELWPQAGSRRSLRELVQRFVLLKLKSECLRNRCT